MTTPSSAGNRRLCGAAAMQVDMSLPSLCPTNWKADGAGERAALFAGGTWIMCILPSPGDDESF